LNYKKNKNYKQTVARVLNGVRKKYSVRGKFSKGDFYRICESENIQLLDGEDANSLRRVKKLYGMLFTFSTGERLVYLRSFFNRNRRLCMKSAMHELGHYFLRHKGFTAAMISGGVLSNSQAEKEANLFARLATKTGQRIGRIGHLKKERNRKNRKPKRINTYQH
jgi:hypothetical protein